MHVGQMSGLGSDYIVNTNFAEISGEPVGNYAKFIASKSQAETIVTRWYQTYLYRDPEPGGLNNYANAIIGLYTFAHKNIAPNITLYRADSDMLDFDTMNLKSKTAFPADVQDGLKHFIVILGGAITGAQVELRNRSIEANQKVTAWYLQYFGRAATQAERDQVVRNMVLNPFKWASYEDGLRLMGQAELAKQNPVTDTNITTYSLLRSTTPTFTAPTVIAPTVTAPIPVSTVVNYTVPAKIIDNKYLYISGAAGLVLIFLLIKGRK